MNSENNKSPRAFVALLAASLVLVLGYGAVMPVHADSRPAARTTNNALVAAQQPLSAWDRLAWRANRTWAAIAAA